MIFLNEKRNPFSFLIWICGAAFFGAAFYLSGNWRWHRIPGLIRALCCAGISLLLIITAVCLALMLSCFNDKGVKNLDYIVYSLELIDHCHGIFQTTWQGNALE